MCNGEFHTEMATCLACYDEETKTLEHAGSHTGRAGLSTLSKIIEKAYIKILKENHIDELNDLWNNPGMVKYLTAKKANQWWNDITDKEKANVCKYYGSEEYDTDWTLSHELRRWLIAETDTAFPEIREKAEENDRKLKLMAVTACVCCMDEFGPLHRRGKYIDKRGSMTTKWLDDRR